MGLFDVFKPTKSQVAQTRSALEDASEGNADSNAIERLVRMVMEIGIDGKGPIKSATAVAERAAKDSGGDVEAAIKEVRTSARNWGAAGGFVTGLGGLVTMPVALPVNVLEFYVQATRMVAAIAALRGYDLSEPQIRTAVMLTLVRSDAEDVLKRAGMATGAGAVTALALKRLPASAMMVVNKAVGFRLLRGVAERFFSRLGRGLPIAGGIIGGGLDGRMMRRIGASAVTQFPKV